jgi:hypothetical protein
MPWSKVSDCDSQAMADDDQRLQLLPISIGQRCFFVFMILARIVTPYPAQSGDLISSMNRQCGRAPVLRREEPSHPRAATQFRNV